jgi:hypothetical protein
VEILRGASSTICAIRVLTKYPFHTSYHHCPTGLTILTHNDDITPHDDTIKFLDDASWTLPTSRCAGHRSADDACGTDSHTLPLDGKRFSSLLSRFSFELGSPSRLEYITQSQHNCPQAAMWSGSLVRVFCVRVPHSRRCQRVNLRLCGACKPFFSLSTEHWLDRPQSSLWCRSTHAQ